jgi:arginase
VLRALGLVERLEAQDLGDVTPDVPYRDAERPDNRVRNEDDVADYSRRLGRRVAEIAGQDQFVVLLGGDCSVLLGALAGLRETKGEVGLVYVDAHADFASLDESPSGSACSMNLALASGRYDEGPLARLAGGSALVEPAHTVHIGRRDEGDAAYGSDALRQSAIADVPARTVRARGADSIAREALERAAAAPGGFWIHFDVDVLDPSVFPATGDLAPGGIDLDEAVELLGPLVQHPSALGMQLTLYDPTLDQDGHEAQKLVDLLERAFA